MDELMDIPEIAKLFRISENQIRAYARDGRLPAFKLEGCRQWRFRKQEIHDFITSLHKKNSVIIQSNNKN